MADRKIVWIGLRPNDVVEVQTAVEIEIEPAKRASKGNPARPARVEFVGHKTEPITAKGNPAVHKAANALRAAVERATGASS
jgi:hypothetical protein